MTKIVSQKIDCVIECAIEPCCRSINYKTTSTCQNEKNCEMFHNLVYNSSENALESNSSYDHVYLVNAQKVRIHERIIVHSETAFNNGLCSASLIKLAILKYRQIEESLSNQS